MKLSSFKLSKFATKAGLNRKMGECDVLKNTTPMRVEGSEVTRYGYSSAGLPSVPQVGGVDVVPDFWQYVSTENPSAKEVLFCFSHISSTQYIHVYSTVPYGTTTWVDGWVLLNESITLTYTNADGGNNSDFDFVGSGAGISVVDDYYNGWMAYKSDGSAKYALIKDFVGSSGTFTTWEDIGILTSIWGTGGADVVLYRNFHAEIYRAYLASSTYAPLFVTPNILQQSGIFRINLGKSSNALAKPIVWGNIKTTIDNVGSVDDVNWKGSYAAQREILQPPANIFVSGAFGATTSALELAQEKTYHVGVCAIYNGYQRSPLRYMDQGIITGGTTNGYLDSSKTLLALTSIVRHYLSTSDKRITAYEVYAAQDDGDTSSLSKARSPYYFIKRLNLESPDDVIWTLQTGSLDYYLKSTVLLDNDVWENRGESWENMSGYISGVETMYSNDLEVNTPTRQWMARVYNYDDVKEESDNLYTNPRNFEGQVQLDIFPDQPEVFTHRVKYGDSSVITGIIPVEQGNILVLKDMTVSKLITNEQTDGGILVQTETISERIGASSPIHGYIKTPYGVYFVGKDDIYVLDNQGLKSLTIDDWQSNYRAIAYATKQAAIVWYRPEEEAIYCKLGSDVYAYFMRYQTWRQASYADALAGYTVKADGTFVWWKTGGTAYKFDTSTTDAGTAITVNVDTGWFRITPTDESARIHRVFLNQNQSTNAPTATLYMSYEGSSASVTPTLTTGTRVVLGIPVTTRSWCDLMKIVYQTTGLVELGEIEIHGISYKKTKAA